MSLLLLIIDTLAFYISLLLAYYTRKVLDLSLSKYIKVSFTLHLFYFVKLWWIPLIYIFFIGYEGLYTKRLPFWEEARQIVKATTIAAIVTFAIVSLGKMSDKISRLVLVFLWFYALFVFPFFRYIEKILLSKLKIGREEILIIGAGNAGKAVAREIEGDRYLGYQLVGFIDDKVENGERDVKVNDKVYKILGKIRELPQIIEKDKVQKVIIAIPSLSKEDLCKLVNFVQRYVKEVFVVPELKGIALMNSKIYYLFMEQLFLLKINNNLQSKLNQMIKRIFDLTLGLLILPIFIPFCLAIGILIKLDSEGPVFFVHRRIGKGGKEIKVIKFRTMYVDAEERLKKILETDPQAKKEWETYFKLKNDPRVTRVGKFLRKTSLDELPQVINVLIGDMSFVGPRPVVKEELDKYYKEFAEFYYMVKPGITGLWQVSGRSNTDYNFRVKLDTWYVLNWSLWLDIIILFKTIKVVLKREGAY
ncbi:sugar transferase [Thermodesulfobacterium hydrogeniphilum]|uniref:sugar transferase n=1 Tax=Thermodesulfobacterium hydrogeniphilum TaxID=161156 RepID=UPI0005708E27|nr:sugar transferase [Thermodesulfobacterium hydrogeniphilum]